MIKISQIKIGRYRSIIEMKLDIDQNGNIISICGPNNVGKTNTLRALNLFFNPEIYDPKLDIPTLKKATYGGAVYPRIEVQFIEYNKKDSKQIVYDIVRDFKNINKDGIQFTGIKYEKGLKKQKVDMTKEQLKEFMNNIQFYFIESANLVIPDLISKITDDMISLQYNKTRFTKSKKQLKEAYMEYTQGLEEILNVFASEISESFNRFRDSWSVKFEVPNDVQTFKDLISDDVKLTIQDKGSSGIIGKGSGLQRLALIILYFEMSQKLLNKKSVIICIDEPDIFLHEGLQRKLKEFLDEKSEFMQIFLTTHSKVFIDTFEMKNTILLNAKYSSQYYKRKNKEIDIMETLAIDIDTDDGYKQICEHLGIEEKNYEVLESFNLLVEGGCDKKYISELCKYFKFKDINIISANGADEMLKYIEFYESYYKNINSCKPQLRVILDNDSKGREIFRKLNSKNLKSIDMEVMLIPNFLGDSKTSLEKNTTNNEIEDFIYPEVICELINGILKKKGLKQINTTQICKDIKTKAFKSSGILYLCEYSKNNNNPDNGCDITFVSSNESSNRMKEAIAGSFNLEGNKKLIKLLNECSIKYPKVKENLKNIIKPFNIE